MENDTLVTVVVGAVMLLGLFGTVLPLVPGLPLIWAAALAYAFDDDWSAAAWTAMTVITLLMAAGIIAKIVLPARRLAETGVPRSTLMLGAIAGAVGFFVIPVIGLPLGAVAGVYAAEQRRTGDSRRAWVSTKSAVIGFGIGTLIEIGAGLAMVATWVVWILATS
jgi:uncharacterized protein